MMNSAAFSRLVSLDTMIDVGGGGAHRGGGICREAEVYDITTVCLLWVMNPRCMCGCTWTPTPPPRPSTPPPAPLTPTPMCAPPWFSSNPTPSSRRWVYVTCTDQVTANTNDYRIICCCENYVISTEPHIHIQTNDDMVNLWIILSKLQTLSLFQGHDSFWNSKSFLLMWLR